MTTEKRIGEPLAVRDGVLTLEPDAVSGGMYHLFNAAIAPRPIAWISTVAEDGTLNLAPHSYTVVLSPKPPIVGFVSIGQKDTLRNARATGELVYHIADESLGERLNRTAADFPPEISEFDWAGLTPIPSDLVRAPRVAEAPIAFEAKVVEIKQILDTDNFLVMSQVIRLHVAESVIANGRIDPALLRPLGRTAGSGYARLGELLGMERPTYKGLLESKAEPMPRR